MSTVLRTRTLSEPRGFLKALIAADSDRILGFTALGAEAGELIAVVQTAMLANQPYTALRDAILTHPTIAEGLTVLFASEPTLVGRRSTHEPGRARLVHMKATYSGFAIGVTLLLAACSREEPGAAAPAPDGASPAVSEAAAPAEPEPGAVAQLAPTQGNTVTGSLTLAQSPEGVRITGSVQGLKPDAEFGFHVHEKGDCSAPDGSSAGEHFNPAQARHGNPASGEHHAGDMLNIRSDAEGVAQVDTTAAGTSLQGNPDTDVMGRAVVVHESPDDYTSQPSGNSGKRVACGAIEARSP